MAYVMHSDATQADIANDEAVQKEDDEFEYLRIRLEIALAEAKSWREYAERSLKTVLPPSVNWADVDLFAEARAREALAVRKLQDLGFKP